MRPYQFTKSYELFGKAQKIIPGGVQASRRPLVPGRAPVYIDHAKGCRCWDVDGNEYIDFCLSWGPIILGYAYDPVDEAAIEMIRKGIVFTQNHPIQNELAEKLCQLIPCAEMVTFMKTGSEVTSVAVRIARAYTGREKIARCGYHGWHDWCNVGGNGVPKVLEGQTLEFDGNRPETLERLFEENPNEIAGVIIAPEEVVPPDRSKFERIKEITHRHGAILIFDEVKTWPRISLGGFQEWIGVIPDIATLSKAMANGFPIGAVVGRKEVMETVNHIWISATFNGETASMAAALKTIQELERLNALEHIWRMGRMLIDGLNEIIREFGAPAEAFGWPLPPMPFMRFTVEDKETEEKLRTSFFGEVISRGVLLHPTHMWFVSYAHKEEDIERTLEIVREAMKTALQ